MRSAMITGASGMLGQALIRLLSQRKIKVYAIVHPGSKQNSNLIESEYIKIVECDLCQLTKLPGMINEKVDAFFHFGWMGTVGKGRDDLTGQLCNVEYTLKAVEIAHELGCDVFLGAGSQAEFGRVGDGVKLSRNVPTNPETGYGIAKLCAGQMSRVLCERLGIRHIWTRILSVYGPGDKDRSMVMSGIVSMMEGKSPEYTKGEQIWDYLYCDDAAMAFYLAAEKGKDGAIYCVGSGEEHTLKEYIEQIGECVNPDVTLTFGTVPYYPKQVMYLCADISDLKQDTGFCPKVDFSEGIRHTYEWRKGRK